MKISKGISPVTRAVGVFSAVAIVTGGVTFAALQSSATLTDSSISTANAELQVYDFTAGQYASTAPGFVIDNLIPGEGVEKSFYLRNNGQTALNVSARVPALPGAPADGFGFSGYENVKVSITGEKCDVTVDTNLQALFDAAVALPCNSLLAGEAGNSTVDGTAGNYDVTFDIDPAVITGSSAGVGDFDIVFTGTAVATPPAAPPAGEGIVDPLAR